jgi:hypothetical protein
MHNILQYDFKWYEFKQIYDNKTIKLYIKNNITLSNLKQSINSDIKRIFNLELDDYDIIDANAPINNLYNEIEHNLPINLDNNLLFTALYHNDSIFYIKPKHIIQYTSCNICYNFRNLHDFTILSCCSQSICNTCITNLSHYTINQCPLCRNNL